MFHDIKYNYKQIKSMETLEDVMLQENNQQPVGVMMELLLLFRFIFL